MNTIIEQLAQKEYELFVVNTTAVAGERWKLLCRIYSGHTISVKKYVITKRIIGLLSAEIQNKPDTLDLF